LCTFIPRKVHKNVATRAALFGTNMHQIVCLLGLRLRPHWGRSQHSQTLWLVQGVALPGKGRKSEGRRERGEGREEEGKEEGGLVIRTLPPSFMTDRRLCNHLYHNHSLCTLQPYYIHTALHIHVITTCTVSNRMFFLNRTALVPC